MERQTDGTFTYPQAGRRLVCPVAQELWAETMAMNS